MTKRKKIIKLLCFFMPKIENANPAPIATDELLDNVVKDICFT